MTTFAESLRGALNQHPFQPGRRGIIDVLDWQASPLKDRVIARMERHVAAHLDLGDVGSIDWSKVDWQALFGVIVKVLLVLLPLL